MSAYQVKNPAGLNVRSGPGTDYEILGALKNGQVVEVIDTSLWLPFIMGTDAEGVTFGWLSAKYLTQAPSTVPVPAPVTKEPAWIAWARQQLGQKEVPGPADNPVIAAWYHLTTLDPSMWHDATAWCAVFVNAGFMLNNIKTIRSARAVDWLGWGVPVVEPKKGDIAIFDFGGGDHHVAYVLAYQGDFVQVIGGNQSDTVTIASYPASSVMGYRRAA